MGFGNKITKYEWLNKQNAAWFLMAAFLISGAAKLLIVGVGSPFVTIDDKTTFEGGFMVWFGQAPPQRMYLESWICGISSIFTYIFKVLLNDGGGISGLTLIIDAYRDFYNNPDIYVTVYRFVMLAVDMITAFFVYLLARVILPNIWQGLGAACVCAMYLFSFNTVWCNIVARPDAMVVFFSTLGLLFYFYSEYGKNEKLFWLSSILFGLAAGMKLHGAFFAIFVCFDLLRVHGFQKGAQKSFPLIIISVLFFCLSAGSPLFDPLLYVKLRMLNARDDISPWIQWGEQFITILRGTGWLSVPIIFYAMFYAIKNRKKEVDQKIKSIIFFSFCWLFLFFGIRQLRAYWMLPVLPVIYIAVVYGLSVFKRQTISKLLMCIAILIMGFQSYDQVQSFRSVEFNELRSWIRANIDQEPFYIFGYDSLMLPKNSACIRKKTQGIQRILASDLKDSVSFTERHVKNWEERAQIVLYDMLGFAVDSGFEYYDFYSTPLDIFSGIIGLSEMNYIMVQQHFNMGNEPEIERYLQKNCRLVTKVTGAGGGGSGLQYEIYKRL